MRRAARPVTLVAAVATSITLTAVGILMLMASGHAETVAQTLSTPSQAKARAVSSPPSTPAAALSRIGGQVVAPERSMRVVRVIYPAPVAQR